MKNLLSAFFPGSRSGIWEHEDERFPYIITKERGKLHLSVSHSSRNLTYEEIKAARYELMPDNMHVVMIFPPQSEFVNLHEFCFHLWEAHLG